MKSQKNSFFGIDISKKYNSIKMQKIKNLIFDFTNFILMYNEYNSDISIK